MPDGLPPCHPEAAVTFAAARFPESCALQRLAVAALASIAYLPAVAAVVAEEALPVVFAAMVAHASDQKVPAPIIAPI